MHKHLGKLQEPVFSLTRIAVGFLFFCHGAQKLFGIFGGQVQPLFSLLGAAGVIEFAGGLLVMFGLFASWAAFLCSGQMAAAYFLYHAPNGLLPIANGGELAAIYAWVFLFMAAHPPDKWSLDKHFRK